MRCDAERSIGRALASWCHRCGKEILARECGHDCHCSLEWEGHLLQPIDMRCYRCKSWVFVIAGIAAHGRPMSAIEWDVGDVWCPRCDGCEEG
jgi:hypothetical protein